MVFTSLDDPKVVAMLLDGAVGIIPTDTIYGIAAAASNKQAVERLYQLKQRHDNVRSGTVIAANVAQLLALGIREGAVHKVAHLWPNPLSIELPLTENLSHLNQTGPHRAFRVVADIKLQEFLLKTGPLLTTSANTFGMSPATNVTQAQEYFSDTVDFYVDAGDLSGRPPSTVAIMRNGKLQVVRPGAVTIDEKGNIV